MCLTPKYFMEFLIIKLSPSVPPLVKIISEFFTFSIFAISVLESSIIDLADLP